MGLRPDIGIVAAILGGGLGLSDAMSAQFAADERQHQREAAWRPHGDISKPVNPGVKSKRQRRAERRARK